MDIYEYYAKSKPHQNTFWATTTTPTITDGILKEDPYNFVGGSVSIKPSSQAGYIFLREWGDYQKEMETKIHMEKLFAINHILKNGDYTTVIWKDGTKTIVKKASDEPDDPEKALLFAMLKKVCGNNGSKMSRYLREAEEKTVIKMPKIKIRERNNGSFSEDDLSEGCKNCIHRHEEVTPGSDCYLCLKEYSKEYMISHVKYLRKCGYSYKKIADELKLSESTVRRYSSKEDKENE